MIRLLLLDVDDFRPIVQVARRVATVRQVGNHLEVSSAGTLTIDRRATGVRHAVWYSCIAGLEGGRVTQFDKDALRIEPA